MHTANIRCITVRTVLWSECLCPPKIHVEILTPPKVIISGGETFGRCLSHEGRTLMNGISVLQKRLQREP